MEDGRLGAVEVPGHVACIAVGVDAADEPGDPVVLVVDRKHDPVSEPVDERPPSGRLGDPCGLDLVIAVAEAAQVLGEGGPRVRGVGVGEGGPRGVPDVPLAGDDGADAAAGQVLRYPAASEPVGVEVPGVGEDAPGARVRVRGRPGGRAAGGSAWRGVGAGRGGARADRGRGSGRGHRDGRAGVVAAQDAVGVPAAAVVMRCPADRMVAVGWARRSRPAQYSG